MIGLGLTLTRLKQLTTCYLLLTTDCLLLTYTLTRLKQLVPSKVKEVEEARKVLLRG